MKKKEMKALIIEAIKNTTDEKPITREQLLMELLPHGIKYGVANNAITKAFKEAGIITSTSTSALKDVREWLEKNMPEIDTYRTMRKLADDLCERFDVNDDTEKAHNAVMKAIKAQLTEEGLPVPRRINLGETKALTLQYFAEIDEANEAADDDTPIIATKDGLAEYLIENVEGAGEDATEDVKKALTITAGTFFNFIWLAWNNSTLEALN